MFGMLSVFTSTSRQKRLRLPDPERHPIAAMCGLPYPSKLAFELGEGPLGRCKNQPRHRSEQHSHVDRFVQHVIRPAFGRPF